MYCFLPCHGHLLMKFYQHIVVVFILKILSHRAAASNCETQPPASIGWVALSSVVCSGVCPASVTSPLISTIWCFRAYKPYIFCEDMILATCQCQHIFCCWVEPSLLLSSLISLHATSTMRWQLICIIRPLPYLKSSHVAVHWANLSADIIVSPQLCLTF